MESSLTYFMRSAEINECPICGAMTNLILVKRISDELVEIEFICPQVKKDWHKKLMVMWLQFKETSSAESGEEIEFMLSALC